MKRMKLDSDSNAETNVLDGIFQPSDLETALWGTKSEVTKYERSGVEPKDVNIPEPIKIELDFP